MKELKITNRLIQCSLSDIERLEKEFDIQLPEYLKTFILQYGGTRTYEDWVNKRRYVDTFFAPYNPNDVDMAKIIPKLREISGDEYYDIGRYDLVPLAITTDQTYFHISIGKDDNGIVYIARFDDDDDKIVLDTVADSLETFINNLERDTEKDKEYRYDDGKSAARSWLSRFILNKDYKEGIRAIKLKIEEVSYYKEDLECIKLCLKDKYFGNTGNVLDIFKNMGVNLKENTEAEAYKWLELLIRNVELDDESQIMEYPLARVLVKSTDNSEDFQGIGASFS